MEKKFLLRKTVWQSRFLKGNLFAILTLLSGTVAMAQINIAPQATVSASQCNTGACSTLNDLNFGTCGTQLMWIPTSNPPTPTPGVDWIQWDWPSPKTFDEMIIHHASSTARSLTGALVQYWDGTNWVNHYTFSNLPQACINSVAIPRLTASRFRITSFQMTGSGQTSNPNFREIEIISAPTGPNDAGVSALISPNAFCIGTEPVTVEVRNYGTNRIDSVFVNWEIDGVLQTGAWLSTQLDTLNGLGSVTANLTLGNLTLAANQSYDIKAWTSLPNNAQDTLNFNDTLEVTATTVVVGTVATSKVFVCSGEPFNLTISPLSSPTGQQFQWQVSTDNINWTNLTGATTPNLIGHTQTASTYYRLSITCNGTVTTNSVFVETNATPISGTVTINSALPTGSGNFASFADLLTILNCSGINGPLTVNVVQNSGPYNEQIVFGTVGGTSATNKITFFGNGNTVAFTSSNTNSRGTLMMDGTKDIIFRDLTFDASGTGTHGVAAQLLGSGTDNITFKNCTFKSSTTATGTAYSGVLIGGTPTGPTTAAASPSHITIDSCEIEGGYYGLVVNGTTTNPTSLNNVVTNTIVKNFYLYGAYFRGQVDFLFENNEVTRKDRTGLSTFYGIYLAGENPGMLISKNRVHGSNNQNTTLTSINYPIYITTSSGTAAKPVVFSNNLIYDINSSGTKYGYYLLNACSNINFYHNTMFLGNPLSTGTAAVRGFSTSAAVQAIGFKNNITMLHDGSSGAQHLMYITTSTSTVDFNNNAYFAHPSTSNLNFGFWGSNRPTLSDWQSVAGQNLDANSNEGDPIFIDPANGDLTPGSNVANNMGANLLSIVPDDYFGIARTTTPDAGAIEFIPLPCLPPFNVSGNVGTNRTIAMGWTSNPDADSVKIEWGLAGFQPGTGDSIFSTTGTYTISQYNNGNLQYNTCYDVYLTSYCGGNAGALRAGPYTYCMPCGVFAAPYFEDFDGTDWRAGNGAADRGDIDGCWDRVPAGNTGGAFAWYVNSGGTTSSSTGPSSDVSGNGKYVYTEASYGSATDTAYLVTPFIDVSTLNQPTLSFWYHMYGQTIVHLVVDVWRDGVWDKNVFTLTGEQQTANSDPWLQAFVPLSNYVNDTIRIQFRGPKGTSFYTDMAIDEVSIDEFPSCLPPTSFGVDTLTSGTATLSWASFGDKFDLEWGLPGFTPGSGLGLDSVKGVTTSPYTLTGLVPGLTMHIYVRDTCDPNIWVGPLLVTIPADHDAAMISLVNPSQFACGDSAMTIELNVANNGIQPITSLPVTVTFSGDFNLVHNHTYTTTIPPGDTVVINVGNINTYTGGNVNVDVLLQLANDQNPFNDSSNANISAIVPYEPQYYPTNNICANLDSAFIAAVSYPGAIYGWYNSPTDPTPMNFGDTLKFPVTTGNTVYLAYLNNKDSLQTTFAAGNSQGGTMFDIFTKNPVSLTGFTVNPVGTSQGTVEVWYRPGSYVGYENSAAGWTLIQTHTGNLTAGGYYFDLTTPFFLAQGQTHALYVTRTSGSLSYTNGTNLGGLYASNSDLDFFEGIGKSHPFGSTFTPRIFNGRIHYGSEGCSDIRVPITYTLNSDTAIAAGSVNVQPAPSLTVDFDASASQNANLYIWNFGDGNFDTTSSPNTTHTYANGGDYNITLIVVDTICSSIDSINLTAQSVNLENHALALGANLFPNPSTGIFTLTMDLPSSQSMNIRIVDMLGRQLWKRDYGNVPSGSFTEEFNLSRAARGVYLLEVTTTNGRFTKRLVIE